MKKRTEVNLRNATSIVVERFIKLNGVVMDSQKHTYTNKKGFTFEDVARILYTCEKLYAGGSTYAVDKIPDLQKRLRNPNKATPKQLIEKYWSGTKELVDTEYKAFLKGQSIESLSMLSSNDVYIKTKIKRLISDFTAPVPQLDQAYTYWMVKKYMGGDFPKFKRYIDSVPEFIRNMVDNIMAEKPLPLQLPEKTEFLDLSPLETHDKDPYLSFVTGFVITATVGGKTETLLTRGREMYIFDLSEVGFFLRQSEYRENSGALMAQRALDSLEGILRNPSHYFGKKLTAKQIAHKYWPDFIKTYQEDFARKNKGDKKHFLLKRKNDHLLYTVNATMETFYKNITIPVKMAIIYWFWKYKFNENKASAISQVQSVPPYIKRIVDSMFVDKKVTKKTNANV